MITRELSQVMGYTGAWDIGLAVNGLREGLESDAATSPIARLRTPGYSAHEYRESATISVWDLEDALSGSVQELVGRLARGLGKANDEWLPHTRRE